ncbi:MAG: VacJ family lipoprotein [Sphingopyxis sp.]|nr:VacJ family lipoprotein [Sphingopyxis sp.]
MFILPLSLLAVEPAVTSTTPAAPVASEQTVPPAETTAPPADPTQDIVVTAETAPPPGDPLKAFNADSFELIQQADEALVAPAARAYEKTLPKPARAGLRNFFQNLREPIGALNYLLQLKVGRAFETLGRFTLNSTVGLAGFIDVAKEKPFNSPRRPNGFANTLGFYGVKPGAYFYLPLIGSTTVRDLVGGTVDGLLYPMAIGKPFTQLEFTIPGGTLSALDYRIENDEKLRSVNEDSADPYTVTREQYLARRQAEIDALRGKLAVVAPPQEPVKPMPTDVPDPAPQP